MTELHPEIGKKLDGLEKRLKGGGRKRPRVKVTIEFVDEPRDNFTLEAEYVSIKSSVNWTAPERVVDVGKVRDIPVGSSRFEVRGWAGCASYDDYTEGD